MIAQDKAVFAQLLTQLGLLYNKSLHPCVLDMYWQALYDYPWSIIRAAFQAHVVDPEKGQYMPKPADVIRCIRQQHTLLASQAWTAVLAAIRSIGSYGDVTFEDPLIPTVVTDMGGWILLCSLTQETLLYRQSDFERRYLAYLIHPPFSCPQRLLGRFTQKPCLRVVKADNH